MSTPLKSSLPAYLPLEGKPDLTDPVRQSTSLFTRRSSDSLTAPDRPRFSANATQGKAQSLTRRLRAAAKKITRSVIRGRQRVKGALSETDGIDPRAGDTFADDYELKGLKTGQRVEVSLTAKFNGYLQLVNAKTGRSLLFGDDTNKDANNNARIVFTAKPRTKYLVRVSSFDEKETGKYTLTTRTSMSSAGNFNFFYGYGLVNASAAVARAAGQNLFTDVPDLGGDSWRLDLVKAPEVWAQGFTGQEVIVAVLDEGVDYNHPDLKNNIWANVDEIPDNGIDDDSNGFVDDVRGWDFKRNSNDPSDLSSDGHGTHVAGIIAAANDGIGTTGVAPSAKIMPIRVLGQDGGTDTEIANGIRYAVDNGAKVINMSLGGDPNSGVNADLEAALAYARQKGVVVVIAAGNERQSLGAFQSGDPAHLASVRDQGIIAGAIDINRKLYIDSNPAGKNPLDFVVAPGVDVRSTIPTSLASTPEGAYANYEGTSMSTPHVAGVAALMLSANPNLTPAQIEQILTSTASRDGIVVNP
ncbi:MAG: S8 family serine peptidase [Cyanobacteria bacterium CRU_2_1]|nr:S8 family serine peptidase [Cyanobacteria bacterium RU_5_0]NJR60087.1 S8 family serine peptidase [Cyanobacteria bacterium CRU_2_1]